LNHIPVVAVPIGVLLLLAGLFRQSRDLIQAALVLWVLVALISIPVLKSGGPAAHVIKDLPGIVRATIHEHAEAAEDCFWGMIGLGGFSLIGLFVLKRGGTLPKWFSGLLILAGLFMTCWFSWVAHLGGLVRHPEVGTGFVPPASQVMTPKTTLTH
jgi:hypothetical protein